MTNNDEWYTLYFDGGSRGNPGIGGCGYIIYNYLGDEVDLGWDFLGSNITNNQAEYYGLINGLEYVNKANLFPLHIKGDSQLVIKQIKGDYNVNNIKLKELYSIVLEIINTWNNNLYTFEQISRNNNKRADELANIAMDLQTKNITTNYIENIKEKEINTQPDRVEQMIKIQSNALELFKKKNQDYGDAFAKFGTIGILMRIEDKIQRAISVDKNKVTLVNDETIKDTLIDLHNYAAMGLMLLDEE